MQTLLLRTIFSCGLSSSLSPAPRATPAVTNAIDTMKNATRALLLIAALAVTALAEAGGVTFAALHRIGARLDPVREADVAIVVGADGLVAAVVAVLAIARLMAALAALGIVLREHQMTVQPIVVVVGRLDVADVGVTQAAAIRRGIPDLRIVVTGVARVLAAGEGLMRRSDRVGGFLL